MAILNGSRTPDDGSVIGEVIDRVSELEQNWRPQRATRQRTRAIMNWGADGIRALLGSQSQNIDDYTPAPGLMISGLNRLAQKIGRPPTLKVDPPMHLDSDNAEAAARKRWRIVTHLDTMQRLDMQLPQVGRWLPGYGFAVWRLCEQMSGGYPYVKAKLVDPYDCYPSSWGDDQEPDELAIIRQVPLKTLARQYPERRDQIMASYLHSHGGIVSEYRGDASWATHGSDLTQIAEYVSREGSWLVAPELGLGFDYQANPLRDEPPFVIVKRFSFDQLLGQYEHMIGLSASMAKLNILAALFIQDNVMSETNVIGDMLSKEYEKGRDAVNHFAAGTRIEKPVNTTNYQVFQMIGTLERQLRIVAGYAPEDDGQTGVSWATGEGFRELRSGLSNEISEYHLVLSDGLQRLDRRRLEWEEREYGDMRKPMAGYENDAYYAETYRPAAHIKGNYFSRRYYGVMASFDEPQKIVTGLQLLQAEVIDVETFQENLDGLGNTEKINERNAKRRAQQVMFDRLLQMASNPGDPRQQQADMALVEIMQSGDVAQSLAKFFTPSEPEMSPAEAQLAGGPAPGATATPDTMSTILSRLEMGGGVEGGIQTVGAL